MQALKKVLVAAASVAGLMAVMAAVPAAAAPVFTITPSGIPGIVGYTPQNATDIGLTSSSLLRQVDPTTQSEVGWAYVTGLTNNGSPVSGPSSGLVAPGGFPAPNTYGLYFTYQATVTGLGAIGTPATGVIAPGGFTYTLYADIGADNTYNPALLTGGGTNPSITGTGNDVVLAVGSSIAGGAGFQSPTGAPTINAINTFILCSGASGSGVLGGATVAASGCGAADGTDYFTAPDPFYSLAFLSATAGSALNLVVDASGNFATLNGIQADVNFIGVPEPLTLSLFGAGLAGVAALRRRRSKKA